MGYRHIHPYSVIVYLYFPSDIFLLPFACSPHSLDGYLLTFILCHLHIVVAQSLSHVQLFSHDPTDYNMPGFPVLHHFLEFTQIYVH